MKFGVVEYFSGKPVQSRLPPPPTISTSQNEKLFECIVIFCPNASFLFDNFFVTSFAYVLFFHLFFYRSMGVFEGRVYGFLDKTGSGFRHTYLVLKNPARAPIAKPLVIGTPR